MAEIKGDAEPEPEAPREPEPAEPAGQDKLSDDEQAALDKIMAEIKGDAEPEQAPAPGAPVREEVTPDDQQAALDKIITEITPDEPEAASDAPPPDQVVHADTISIDEFNDELTNLLSSSPENNQADIKSEPAPTPSDSEAKVKQTANGTDSDLTSVTESAIPDEEQSAEPTEKREYSMLQEVAPATQKRSAKQGAEKPALSRKSVAAIFTPKRITAALLVLFFASAAYWGFGKWQSGQTTELAAMTPPQSNATALPSIQKATKNPVGSLLAPPSTETSPLSSSSSETVSGDMAPQSPFARITSRLETAHHRLNLKIQEVKELMAYYQQGVFEEQQKIESILDSSPVKGLGQALENNQISLSLHAMQRRRLYRTKLNTPLRKLEALSEELLYLERKTKLYRVLSRGIGNLPVQGLEQEVESAVQRQIEQSGNLSIDHIDVKPPSFELIWKDLLADIGNRKSPGKAVLNRQDQQISQEICKGDYERKALLTTLNPETAACLSQWHGKDLYLNNVTQLTPESAMALAQWPGEWLSLNGIQDMSPESARQIALWPGKRLSLNGLRRLSRQATERLSQWNGEQLEMIGLDTIGGWGNYATRLYLSEALQRKLRLK